MPTLREREPDGRETGPPARPRPAAPHPLLALQAQAGNRAVAALVARQGAPAAAPAAAVTPASDEEVLKWPSVLAVAAREAGKRLEVTQHADKAPTLNDQEATGGILSTPGDGSDKRAKVEALIAAIRQNRSRDTSFLKLTGYKHKSAGNVKGYVWSDPGGTTGTPKALEGEAAPDTLEGRRKLAQQWVWEELSHEGGSLSINAYDEMRLTWGRGMAGAHLKGFVRKVFADEETRKAFLRFGIDFDGDWKVVNVANGAVETGEEALHLMQAHPEILAAFRYAAEGHPQAIADAQWGQMAAAGAGKVPDALLAEPMWPKASIQIMAHIHHGGDARGYPKLDYYKSEGAPDPGALWTGWMKLLAGSPDPNGAHVVSSQTHHVAEMRAWGGGAIIPALGSRLRGPFTMTREAVGKAPELKDQVAMAMPGGKSYLVWPAAQSGAVLTDDQCKSLGEDRVSFLNQVNGYSIKDMLDAFKAREADVKRWLKGGAEIQAQSAATTAEERLWWAMKVVANKTVPARPKGKDPSGNDLVSKAGVIAAYTWLGKKPPSEDAIP